MVRVVPTRHSSHRAWEGRGMSSTISCRRSEAACEHVHRLYFVEPWCFSRPLNRMCDPVVPWHHERAAVSYGQPQTFKNRPDVCASEERAASVEYLLLNVHLHPQLLRVYISQFDAFSALQLFVLKDSHSFDVLGSQASAILPVVLARRQVKFPFLFPQVEPPGLGFSMQPPKGLDYAMFRPTAENLVYSATEAVRFCNRSGVVLNIRRVCRKRLED